MRNLALLAAVALSACAASEDDSRFPDPSGLYQIQGAAVVCPGASQTTEPLRIDCEWTCLDVDGREVRWVNLGFDRDDATSPWREPIASWDFHGFAEMCR